MLKTMLAATLALPLPLWAGELPDPLTNADFPPPDMAEVRLGQLLFFDPILSGNRNIACATCHHPRFATGDGVSLGLGEGGTGLGPDRRADPANLPEQRIPRNAPPLFNLGARQVTALFADGRIEVDPARPGGLRTPLEDEMVTGFANLLSAQTMFPVLSPDEMAGHYQENEVSKLVRQGRLTGPDGAWGAIAARVAAVPSYARDFRAVYPEIAAGRPVGFTDISNAIAAFMAFEWRADDSPFDRILRGDGDLPPAAARGLSLFFGKAGCGTCHSGPLLSDMGFHAMGQPQIGPGKAERFENHQKDVGRMRVTGRAEDAHAFRTPPLRNVVETGPWGHAGAYSDLRRFVVAHLDPKAALASYAPEAILPRLPGARPDFTLMDDPGARAEIAATVRAGPVMLSEEELDDLMAFLASLTDPASLDGRLGIPETVPSGLPLDR
ncbi:cytochrome-c peroxidase [Albidovulum sediminis]|uniref:Cytochrome-c peroxidase n=1 Tax=Albidovulum sediminis TaxID=3066345 RepID=A0ABT2NNN5_9RHOB|nr:cytochrome c peroxidase [Defluviimonas sediminis]MCT8330543.1 cytochrome-c peroxidase [Defluviimonas sediminis]